MQTQTDNDTAIDDLEWGQHTRRAEVLSRVAFTLAAIMTVYLVLVSQIMPGITPAKIVGGLSVLSLFIAGLKARSDRYYNMSAITVVAVTILGGLGASLTNGGLMGYITPILITAPMGAAVFMGGRAAIIASVAVILAFGVQYVLGVNGFVQETPYPAHITKLAAGFMLMTATLIGAATLHTFASDAQKMIRSLIASKRALRDSKEKLNTQVVELQATNAQLEKQASQIVELIENLDAEKRRAEKLSVTDPLTQISNRLQIDRWLSDALTRSNQTGAPVSVIIFDIDHFKQVNDTYGHLVGDNVLKRVAVLTEEIIRPDYCAGRWGGEEFIILCPDTTRDEAAGIAERLRLRLREEIFEVTGPQTASFGVAQYHAGEDLDDLISRVDDRLYAAKEAGRNQVVSITNSGNDVSRQSA